MSPMDLSGGGGYSADFGATATNMGGTNTVGGTVFGNYSAAPVAKATTAMATIMPWLVAGVVVFGLVVVMKKK